MNLADTVDNMPDDLNGRDTEQSGDTTTDAGASSADSQTDRGTDSDTPTGNGKGESKGGSEGDSGGDSAGAAGDGEGYIADESDEEEPTEPPKEPKEPEQQQELTPELKYIVDRLPVLSTRGKDGKTYQVKAAGQLPDDFEFATKRDELLFTQALASQELKAQQLQSEFVQGQQNQAAQEFTEKENKDIRKDIGDLQREGKLGRFKYAPDDAKFNEDPAVVEANKVIDFMNQANAKYLEAANKGGVLYHLSFKDAYNLMPRDTKPTTQQREDQERRQAVRKTAGAASSAPSAQKAPPTYMGDLRDMVDMMDLS
jgi:hypothetical protein